MGDIKTVTVFDHNGVLAVDLPEGFHAPDGKVRVIREGNVIRIEREQTAPNPTPLPTIGRTLSSSERTALLSEIQDLTAGDFMPSGRGQHLTLEDRSSPA